ncbi:MAG: choice-of-anchor J domain-containing protein [Gramella sp.]|nr:choice-of-anchor J domain-containing protein [Christiangramia sp.]
MNNRVYFCLILVVLFYSCIKTDDYDAPGIEIPNINIEGDLTSISAIKGNYKPETEEIYTFNNSNIFIEGYVVSSDAGGNFYKKIIIQDKPENPTSGIQILLDDNSLYEIYDIGRKVFIKLDGLSLGFNNGVLQLGYQNRGDVIAVPNSLITSHVIRTNERSTIVPKNVRIDEVTEETKNLYIRLDKVQFDLNLIREENRYSFASNVVDRFDGERQMTDCSTGSTIFLSTSTYSDFNSLLLPTGSGSLEGVLSRNYYDEHYVVVVNTPEALEMEEERCDPAYLDCGDGFEEGLVFLLDENFDGVTSNTTLNSRKWTNINISGGEKKFTPTLSSGNRVLRISAYNTNESPLEAWLVTPEIDLDTTEGEILIFDLLSSYDNGLLLTVYVSRDFDGDPRTSTWIPLDAKIPLGPSGSNAVVFKESKIDISCLEGKVWIGFRYLGAAPDQTTTYDLDNIRITGN